MKKYIIALVSILLIGYILFSVFYFNKTLETAECIKLEVIVRDSSSYSFINKADIENVLKRIKLHPVGLLMSDVNTLQMHDAIMTNKLIKSVEVYTTHKNVVVVKVSQRVPVFRVISDIKGSFYVDNNREIMPISQNFSIYVPIATGAISEEYATNDLFDFIEFLNDNPYWDAWFEQIEVKSNKDVVLIPRVGDFKILFGKMENFNEKLSKFSLFIDKGLDKVGWNRYSEINLKFDNQVVCTKR